MKQQYTVNIEKKANCTLHIHEHDIVLSGETLATIKNGEKKQIIISPTDAHVDKIEKKGNKLIFFLDSSNINIEHAEFGGKFVAEVAIGDNVKENNRLGYIAAYGDENPINSHYSGIIKRILIQSGRGVLEGDALFLIDSRNVA